ncbi:MAG: response regulator [Anaerolineales bacterium]|nr:response regulator [Anaerolineales bacterium]
MNETVLILDDDISLLESLSDYLEIAEFSVLTANNGIEGLARMKEQAPDIIVCDIMMPEMDGYAFFKQVREHREWLSIPFVFLSAKGEPEDVQHGYAIGADLYLKKPFDPDELITILRSKLQRAKELDSVVKTKIEYKTTSSLAAYDYELRAPLQLIQRYMRVFQERKAHVDPKEVDEVAHVMRVSLSRLVGLFEDLTMFVYIQSVGAGTEFQSLYQNFNLSRDLQQLVEEFRDQARQRGVTLHSFLPDELLMHGHAHYIREVFKRLIDNAIKFGQSDGNVWIEATRLPEMVRVSIRDDGMGIAKDEFSRLFSSFKGDARVRIDLQGAGLGLAIAGKIVSLHGGEIKVESALGKGSTFEVWLPQNHAEV